MNAHEFVAQMTESELIHILEASSLGLSNEGCLEEMDLADTVAIELRDKIKVFMDRY